MENIRGIALMTAAMFGFAIEDALVKTLSVTMPVGQILILLGLGGALIFGGIAWAQGTKLITRDLLDPLMLTRNLGEMFGTMAFVSALALSPMSLVAAIIQAMPLMVTMGAALFLGAPVGWRRWSAIIIGFIGVLIIIRPGTAEFDIGAVLALLGVTGLTARDLATRVMPAKYSSMKLSCYGFFAVVPAGLLLWAFSGGAFAPQSPEVIRLAAALLAGVMGYYALTLSMRMGDISVITPFRYSRLLFALILGAIVFGERPDAYMLTGSAIVISAGLYTLIREARLARAAQQAQSTLSSDPTSR
ncbi:MULTISPECIES: DMT family transporter [unclassified Roseobacter]|uniref:DMT family transporter n=1 Tax=unclassified Roseobacter TaxID=196798 RepID=UPI0030EE63D6